MNSWALSKIYNLDINILLSLNYFFLKRNYINFKQFKQIT
jgi:hypothetical protein